MASRKQYVNSSHILHRPDGYIDLSDSTLSLGSRGSRQEAPSAGASSDTVGSSVSLEPIYGLHPAQWPIEAYTAAASHSESMPLGAKRPEEHGTSVDIPPTLRSDPQTRDQLMQRFYDLHIGDSSNARRIFAFEALDLQSPSKYATKAAMDTLCLAQIATTFEDAKLLGQARSMYAESLRHLSLQMERLNPQMPNKVQLDDVIGALHALTSCAFFTCCAEPAELEWMHYTKTTLKILDVFGWEALDPVTRHAYYYNWKYRAFFEGLTRRTKITFKEPTDVNPVISAHGLTEHIFDVPGLLWRTDRFIEASGSGKISPYMIVRLLTEIGACISRLKQWYLNWLKDLPPALRYRTRATKTFNTFKQLCGDHLDTFPLAYDFLNATHVRDMRTYSLCMIKLDEAIMDVNQAFQEHCESDQLKIQLRQAQSDAESSAADLCMLIPWCTQPQNMAFASVHSFMPLHFASAYYARQGKLRQFEWCRKVTRSLVEKYGIEIRYPD